MKRTMLSMVLLTGLVVLTAEKALAKCGDVTGDDMISASDALSVLRAAVGDHRHPMMCEPCGSYTTTTTRSEASTTTVGGAETTTTLATGSSFTLHVASGGMMSGGSAQTGHGRVTSDPSGIDCGTDCTQTYDAGSSVTLTAVASSDSDFVGWWGDVPSSCVYNDDPCTLDMDRDHNVWAMFRRDMMGR